MYKATRIAFTMVIAVALVAISAGAVIAAVSKTGTLSSCSYNFTAYVQSYSTGFTEHFPPGSGYRSYQNGGTWTTRKTLTNAGTGTGGWWGVYVTNGSLSDPNTFAGCQLTGN
jgi:hypothetical protein